MKTISRVISDRARFIQGEDGQGASCTGPLSGRRSLEQLRDGAVVIDAGRGDGTARGERAALLSVLLVGGHGRQHVTRPGTFG